MTFTNIIFVVDLIFSLQFSYSSVWFVCVCGLWLSLHLELDLKTSKPNPDILIMEKFNSDV